MSYHVYILASRKNGTLYVGITNDLARRVFEHKQGVAEGFSKRYEVHSLVYYEAYEDVRAAIQREKNIKHWPRAWKVTLIENDNPDWLDLYETLNA